MLLLHFYISFLFKTIQTQTKRVSGTTILWSTLSSSWQWVCASVQCCAVLCWCVPSRCNWTWWMVWRCPGWPSPCCAGPWLPEVRGCEQLPADQSPGEVTREAQCCGHRWSAAMLLRGRDILCASSEISDPYIEWIQESLIGFLNFWNWTKILPLHCTIPCVMPDNIFHNWWKVENICTVMKQPLWMPSECRELFRYIFKYKFPWLRLVVGCMAIYYLSVSWS